MELSFILFFFHAFLFGVGLAQGDDKAYIGWTVLILVILVLLVFIGILCLNPGVLWACWYCFKDFINKCCPNLIRSSCSQQQNNPPIPIEDEPPPPYDEVVDSRRLTFAFLVWISIAVGLYCASLSWGIKKCE